MFTREFRDHVRHRVLELAKADPRVTAAALIGSTALGTGDQWSDVDVAFGIADGNGLETVVDDWTEAIDKEFGVVNHFDLQTGGLADVALAGRKRIFRVFLLHSGLEVDISLMPTSEFGGYGPHFRTLFGTTQPLEAPSQPETSYVIGLSWLHVLHARASIERNRGWQAEYWISGLRDQILTLACLRLGEDARYGRGWSRLPASTSHPLSEALVRSLDATELRRALAVGTLCLIGELEQSDEQLCARLAPLLREFGAPPDEVQQGSSSLAKDASAINDLSKTE
jgi:predicted nucleotidyltransferase